MSKVTWMTKLDALQPQMGKDFYEKEKEVKQEEPPDPTCSCWCCPYTPPPPGETKVLLERYCHRHRKENDVYGRKLSIRPLQCCSELCCGRGCNCEFSCCCCCQLDELLTDFIVTTHRIVVEQRCVQRYCRFFACCRKTPNIRTTYLAQ